MDLRYVSRKCCVTTSIVNVPKTKIGRRRTSYGTFRVRSRCWPRSRIHILAIQSFGARRCQRFKTAWVLSPLLSAPPNTHDDELFPWILYVNEEFNTYEATNN